MSTAHTAYSHLRLLERPMRPASVSRPKTATPVSLGQWCAQQLERYFAWGERLRHHRMGSYTAH
jgi:hypothetical protein